MIAVDLPGFGATPPLAGEVSIATLADAVETFIDEQGLAGIDTVGSSMGAQMVLELARRGVGGTTVALDALIDGPPQQGAPAGSTPGRVVIGWGRQDRVTFPSQAENATRLFPDAQLHWFEHCGHFPHWDAPEATIRLILASTA